MEITIPVAMLMSAGSTLAGISGTWAVLKYKVDRAAKVADDAHVRLNSIGPIASTASAEATEALRFAKAAHRRVDEQSERLNAVKSRADILEERSQNQGKRVEQIATEIMDRLDRLDGKLDEAIKDGVIAGRK